MQLQQARTIALGVYNNLLPVTTKINVAGSIRRKKLEVKDIEIVCLPATILVDATDLFGPLAAIIKIDPKFIQAVNALGKTEKGTPNGRYMKIVLPEGINLDLFIPDEADYFRQLAIRTGSADYSHKVIAAGWRKLGWVGSDLGLRLEKDCSFKKLPDGKLKWTCFRNKNSAPPHWISEREFFEWLGVPYLEPEFRNI